MTTTELTAKDQAILNASAKLRAYADLLAENDDEGSRMLEALLRRISEELWELV